MQVYNSLSRDFCQDLFSWLVSGRRKREREPRSVVSIGQWANLYFEIIGILEAQGFEVWRSGLWLFFYIYHFSFSTEAFLEYSYGMFCTETWLLRIHMHYILQRYLQFSSGISHFSSRNFHFPELNSIFFTNFDRALRGVRVEDQGITRRKGGTRRHSSGNALDLRPYPTQAVCNWNPGHTYSENQDVGMVSVLSAFFMPQLFLDFWGEGGISSVPPLTLCSICQLPSPKNSEHSSVFPFSLLMLALFFSFFLRCTSSPSMPCQAPSSTNLSFKERRLWPAQL